MSKVRAEEEELPPVASSGGSVERQPRRSERMVRLTKLVCTTLLPRRVIPNRFASRFGGWSFRSIAAVRDLKEVCFQAWVNLVPVL
jgi:hypothetical protein